MESFSPADKAMRWLSDEALYIVSGLAKGYI